MKKVMFVCPTATLKSGGEKSNYQLIKYLQSRGFELMVITPFRGDYNKTLTQDNIKNKVIPCHWWTDQEWDGPPLTANVNIQAVRDICQQIDRFKPDVVVTNTLNIPWGAIAASFMAIPHIWIAREFSIGGFTYLHKKMGFINEYSNRIMANSGELAEYISTKYGFENVGHFYSFVDDSSLELGDIVNVARIVSISQINERKNQEDLVRAIGLLRREDQTFTTEVLLIGEPEKEYYEKVKKIIAEEGVGDSIKLCGFHPLPWKLVSGNDILVQTSKSESIGRTTTEAMKLGIPVIASDIPGHQEAFRLGGGITYNLGDPQDLARKIKDALSGRESLRGRSAQIAEKTKKTMSEVACSQPFVEAIETISKQKNPQALSF